MRIVKSTWKFSPDSVKASGKHPIEIHIYNEDPYQHGFYLSELNINALLEPEKETVVTIASASAGIYGFYCSVLCGDGHYRMSGKLIVTD